MGKHDPPVVAASPMAKADQRCSALRAELIERRDELRVLQNRYSQLKRESDTLKRDLNHILRQSQSTVAAIVRLRARRSGSTEIDAFARRLQLRVGAMASVYAHADLASARDRINIAPVLGQIAREVATNLGPPRGIGLSVHAVDLDVAPETARCLALITTELVENAFDHAFVDRKFGKVELRVGPFNDHAGMLWVHDNGIGAVPGPFQLRQGFGWQTIEALVQTISADLVYERTHGTRIGILFPN